MKFKKGDSVEIVSCLGCCPEQKCLGKVGKIKSMDVDGTIVEVQYGPDRNVCWFPIRAIQPLKQDGWTA